MAGHAAAAHPALGVVDPPPGDSRERASEVGEQILALAPGPRIPKRPEERDAERCLGERHAGGDVVRRVLHDHAFFGEKRHLLLWIALVVEKDPEQKTIRLPVANMEDQAGLDGREAAGLHDVRHEIGARLTRGPTQLPQAQRRYVDR